MRELFVLTAFCLLTSCDFFASKEKRTSKLVEQELRQIDWTDVDNYPLFDNCDETVSKTAQRHCFEKELLGFCSKALSEFEYHLNAETDSKVLVDLLVDQEGRIKVLDIQKDSAIADQMPNFDEIIRKGIEKIPPLAPALKRGIPVRTKFRIPIVLRTHEE